MGDWETGGKMGLTNPRSYLKSATPKNLVRSTWRPQPTSSHQLPMGLSQAFKHEPHPQPRLGNKIDLNSLYTQHLTPNPRSAG